MVPRSPHSCTVYTPKPLASAMVGTLGNHNADVWLDPCVGEGVFVQALAELGINPDRITAIDLEPTSGTYDHLAQTRRGVDFLEWSRTTDRRYAKVVCNPPYVALNRLDPNLQRSALLAQLPDGHLINFGSNYWLAFLCASLRLLRPGGSLCFVLPAAWDYADYAKSIRKSLPWLFDDFEIHRSREPLFDTVQDGSVVIVGRGFSQAHRKQVRYEYESADDLIAALISTKYKRSLPIERVGMADTDQWNGDSCGLGEIMEIGLGGVTGDARYFLLTEAERLNRKLPVASLRPVLSKARHLIAGEITEREWKTLLLRGERVWLFDPPPRLSRHPAVRAYLNLDSEAGGCQRDRHKIKERSPWYKTPLPRRVDGFMSGMTRLGPWISLRTMPRLTANNTLYTVRFHTSLSEDEQAAWALSLLTSQTRQILKSVGRIYPDGLVKYEPRDLADIPLMTPKAVRGAKARYLEAVEALLSGSEKKCQDIADNWFTIQSA